MVVVIAILRIQGIDPICKGFGDLIPVAFAEHGTCLMTGPVVRALQVVEQGGNAGIEKFGLLYQGTSLCRDAPYSPMLMITAGITEVMLGMVDDRVVPIGNIKCPVGAYLAVDRAKVRVAG